MRNVRRRRDSVRRQGHCVELDFAEPVRLRTDDALVLDHGGLVEIVAEPEPLFEVRAADLRRSRD